MQNGTFGFDPQPHQLLFIGLHAMWSHTPPALTLPHPTPHPSTPHTSPFHTHPPHPPTQHPVSGDGVNCKFELAGGWARPKKTDTTGSHMSDSSLARYDPRSDASAAQIPTSLKSPAWERELGDASASLDTSQAYNIHFVRHYEPWSTFLVGHGNGSLHRLPVRGPRACDAPFALAIGMHVNTCAGMQHGIR